MQQFVCYAFNRRTRILLRVANSGELSRHLKYIIVRSGEEVFRKLRTKPENITSQRAL
jgi:hypothetical protein